MYLTYPEAYYHGLHISELLEVPCSGDFALLSDFLSFRLVDCARDSAVWLITERTSGMGSIGSTEGIERGRTLGILDGNVSLLS